MFEKPTPHCKKIFRGAYGYFKNETSYAEENFEVYKDNQELGMYFLSKLHSRVATGELLNIDVVYNITKDYIPNFVTVHRSLGKDSVQENYDLNPRKGVLKYTFIKNDEEEITQEVRTPPKFHITAPTTCSSMLFLRSKKFDSTSKNYYTFISSNNQWSFGNQPYSKNITLQRMSSSTEKLVLDGNNLQAVEYKLAEDDNETDTLVKTQGFAPSIRIFLSPYVTIPYLLRTPDGNRVQIKFLNNLTDKE